MFEEVAPLEFQRIVGRLLIAEGFTVQVPPSRGADVGVDLFAIDPSRGETWAVQIRHFRRVRVHSGAMLRAVASQLIASQLIAEAKRALLVVNVDFPPAALEKIARFADRTGDITIWDASTLREVMARHPHAAEVSAFDQPSAIWPTEREPLSNRAAELRAALEAQPCGDRGWRNYEDLCVQILNFLFVPPLGVPRLQMRSDDGLDRRDAIYKIGHGEPIWDSIKAECRTRFLVAEFKNSCSAPTQRDIESLQQYLFAGALRSFGCLCSRKKASESAVLARRRAWSESMKLIVLLSDDDLAEMLEMKVSSERPAELIDAQVDDFLMSFSA